MAGHPDVFFQTKLFELCERKEVRRALQGVVRSGKDVDVTATILRLAPTFASHERELRVAEDALLTFLQLITPIRNEVTDWCFAEHIEVFSDVIAAFLGLVSLRYRLEHHKAPSKGDFPGCVALLHLRLATVNHHKVLREANMAREALEAPVTAFTADTPALYYN